jgi:hypothetical protein
MDNNFGWDQQQPSICTENIQQLKIHQAMHQYNLDEPGLTSLSIEEPTQQSTFF